MKRLAWLLALCLLWPSLTQAAVQNCTIAWTARTEADLAGYRISWGTASGTYTSFTNVGLVTTTTCASIGITSAGTYYLIVRAFDTSNQLAANSNQVTFTLATVADPPTAPTITGFTPSSGIVGTSVTISGTNFSSTLSSNIVKFNGTTASLSSGNSTQLTATVPSGASTGKISVTVGSNTATSSGDFTITTPPASSTYDSELDFSGTQGPIWYYLDQADVQMTYSSGLWSGSELYQGLWDSGGHPGNSGGTAKRRFVVPSTGTYNVSGVTGDADAGGGDGVTVTIVYNSVTTLYTRTMANGAGDLSYSFTQAMTAGDTLDFIISRNVDTSYDSTHFTAHLAVSGSPPSPPPSPTPPGPTPPPPSTVNLLSLTASASTIFVGESLVLTATLDTTTTTTTTITINNTDPSILATPSTIAIPAGAKTAGFTVLGMSTGNTTVSASLGSATKTLSLVINPLATVVSPTLLAPSDQVELPATTRFVILRWQAIPNAVRYELRVRDDTVSSDNTSTCVGYRICMLDLINTSYRIELKRGHSYTWFVRWTDIAGNTSVDSQREFSVHLNP
jgi:hypothetical protein